MYGNDFHSHPGLNSSSEFLAGKAGQLVCRPAQWTDVVKFFFLNYGLHAITVITRPGDTTWPSITAAILAIFVPFSGIHRALTQIYKFPRSEVDALQTARKAGALCTVVSPYQGDPTGEPISHARELISSRITKVHGQYPEKDRESGLRYELVKVPEWFTVTPSIEPGYGSVKRLKLSCNYSVLKPVAAILQILYSSMELYAACGHQFERFGYAAYSLSVIPYVLMSLTNLLASTFAPQYPSLFIVLYKGKEEDPSSAVKSGSQLPEPLEAGVTTTENAARRVESTRDSITRNNEVFERLQNSREKMEGLINGAVGVAYGNFGDRASRTNRPSRSWIRPSVEENLVRVLVFLIGAFTIAAPYVMIKLLTNFKPGESSKSQRGWMISWIVVGQVCGSLGLALEKTLWKDMASFDGWRSRYSNRMKISNTVKLLIPVLGMSVGAIGGFVVVAKMILSDQVCKTI